MIVMKRLLAIYIMFVLAVSQFSSCGAQKKVLTANVESVSVKEFDDYAPDRLIIMYDEKVGKEPLTKAISEYGAEIIYDYSIIPGMAIKIPEGKTLEEAMAFFKKVDGVVSVEKDHIIRLTDPVKPKLEIL
jgi:hypothetical protein